TIEGVANRGSQHCWTHQAESKTEAGSDRRRQAERIFSEGNVSIISRSGGMSAETSWMLKREGLGVSLNIAIGGDPILGTTMKEMLQILEHDPETGAAVLFCEPGGAMEEEVAEFRSEEHTS